MDPVSGMKGCGFGSGPVYHYDNSLVSTVKFPPFFNDKWITHGIQGAPIKMIAMAPPPTPVAAITPAQVTNPPWGSVVRLSSGLHDLEFGPGDGALYLLDYGGGSYMDNSDAALKRITYQGCLPTPLLEKSQTHLVSPAGLKYSFGCLISPPQGAHFVEIFNLNGDKIWETQIQLGGSKSLSIPKSLGTGMMWMKFK